MRPANKARVQGPRTHLVNFRLNDWEYERYRELARKAGMSMTDYFLARTVYARKVSMADTTQLNDVIYELRKIGTNINQVARAANTFRLRGSAKGVADSTSELAAMRKEVTEAIGSVTKTISAMQIHRIASDEEEAALDAEETYLDEGWSYEFDRYEGMW